MKQLIKYTSLFVSFKIYGDTMIQIIVWFRENNIIKDE